MTVEIVLAGSGGSVRMILKGAIITSYTVSDDREGWTLQFEELEQSTESE
jgi:hypothetical protein